MVAYRQAVEKLGGHFAGYSVEWIDRRKNDEADALSRIGSARLAPPTGVFLDMIAKTSVSPPREIDISPAATRGSPGCTHRRARRLD